MNPKRGISARDLLRKLTPAKLAALLLENANEACAPELAEAIAGRDFPTTRALAEALRLVLPKSLDEEEREQTARRIFQAIRIEVNEEFTALDALLRQLPGCLRPGGRVAVLTFHSGEDRRVKHAFREGFRAGIYGEVNREVIRATAEERRNNPRSSSAKLRWAVRADTVGN
jgi:16S rRNA (cytosine1402-N4)-methyltransferase